MYAKIIKPIKMGSTELLISPLEVISCDPDFKLDERPTKPWWQFWNASMYVSKGQSNHISQSEYQI